MPKEMVHDEAGMYDVHIGWERDKYVQVGVESADRRAIVDKLINTTEPEAREALDRLLGDGEAAAFTGLWGTLDRAGCNRLIRVLRQARDQAFGKDE
jgi:hypothetical protein